MGIAVLSLVILTCSAIFPKLLPRSGDSHKLRWRDEVRPRSLFLFHWFTGGGTWVEELNLSRVIHAWRDLQAQAHAKLNQPGRVMIWGCMERKRMRSYLYKKGRIIKWTLLIFLTHLQLSEEGCQWCSFLLVKISLYTENSRWIRSIGQDLENIMLLSWKCHFLCRRYSLGSPERFLFLPDSNESSYKFLPFNLSCSVW